MRRAFSLVELSIVLVILGLLVGGILAGQSLIRAAELRSVVSQQQRHIAAVYAFKDKYFALPGDMTNATAFWTAAAACPGTAQTIAAATCNGDGDGRVFPTATSSENYRFWQHLANAGLIEGTFSGVDGNGNVNGWTAVPTNAPTGRLSRSIWWTWNWGTTSGLTELFNGTYSNSFEFGGQTANYHATTPIMKNEELWNLDSKLDDGKPATGKVVTEGVFTGCTDASAASTLTASYLLSSSTPSCVLVFRQQF